MYISLKIIVLKSEVYEILLQGNTSRAIRSIMLSQIQQQHNAIAELLSYMFDTTSKVQFLASIILDDWLVNKADILDRYIDSFITQLPKIKDESTKRLASKMALFLVKKRKDKLCQVNQESLFNQSLEWLTQDSKVATEANAMQIVMQLCDQYPQSAFVIGELIEVKYAEKTPAYQSGAKKLIQKINKLKAKQIAV